MIVAHGGAGASFERQRPAMSEHLPLTQKPAQSESTLQDFGTHSVPAHVPFAPHC
jgi:hypothetical protein